MENNKEYLASVLARLDTMLYRHTAHTYKGKMLHEPAGYTGKLFTLYMGIELEVLQELYRIKKVVLEIEGM